jgi:DNA polymerase-3 subunit delta
MKELQKAIKEKQFNKFYLFTGDEEHLKDYYANLIAVSIVNDTSDTFNYLKMFSDINYDMLVNFVYSPPVFCDKKVLIIKNCKLFKSVKENEKKIWIDVFENAPDDVVFVFIENEFDKKTTLWKKINSIAKITEFKHLKDNELENWVRKGVSTYGIKIEDNAAHLLVAMCSNDMKLLKNEIVKLYSYKKDEGIITEEDVEISVGKTVENRVFEMIDNISKGNIKKALEMFYDLKTLNEPPERILSNISNEFLRLRIVKLLCDKFDKNYIAKEIKLSPYFVVGYIEKAKKMSIEKINEMVCLCQQTDYFIKNTIKDKWAAIENILIQSQIN